MEKVLSVYKNGNHQVTIMSDGTKIKETFDPAADHFTYDFAENVDIKITDYCDGGCPYCHENSTIKGKHGDLKSLEKLFKTITPGTELAIGGGNALAHPDLIWFLELLKEQGVVANITVNQKHIEPYKDLLIDITNRKLVNGIGISLTNSKTFDKKFVKSLSDNVVIHTIAGVLSEEDLPAISGMKALILGYKHLRRGNDYFSDEVIKRIHWLREYLPVVAGITKVLSFDCLGIEQLDPKKTLKIKDEDWNGLFQGSDTDVKDKDGNITCATFYIDVPNMTCARMSTAALDKRFTFTSDDDIKDLFKKSIQAW